MADTSPLDQTVEDFFGFEKHSSEPKFDLNTIVSHIKEHPIFEPNRYEVVIAGPMDVTKAISFNAHTCAIPGYSLGTFEHSIIGPKRKHPNDEIMEDLSISFYNSHHLEELEVMYKWIRMISGDETYRLAYYEEYVADINIFIYDLKEELTAVVRLAEAYPTSISEVELSYAGEAPSSVVVTFSYHSYNFKVIRKQEALTEDDIDDIIAGYAMQ